MIEHNLVPKHEVLSLEDAQRILEKYNCTKEQLPKIFSDDPAIKEMESQIGDVIRIHRKNDYVGNSYYYRVVI